MCASYKISPKCLKCLNLSNPMLFLSFTFLNPSSKLFTLEMILPILWILLIISPGINFTLLLQLSFYCWERGTRNACIFQRYLSKDTQLIISLRIGQFLRVGGSNIYIRILWQIVSWSTNDILEVKGLTGFQGITNSYYIYYHDILTS